MQDIDQNTDYQSFKRRWGEDPRFLALDRKERESLLNERYKLFPCRDLCLDGKSVFAFTCLGCSHGLELNLLWRRPFLSFGNAR